MSVSKKLRFEVFKRDGFQCAYCGRTPPTVTLEVDHIHPKSKGSSDDINNLVTACFDCNRGKTNVLLTKIPTKLSDNLDALKEKEEQINEYNKYVKKIKKRLNKQIEIIDQMYIKKYVRWGLSDTFKDISLRKFLTKLPLHEVEEAMELSLYHSYPSGDRTIKYFCGICWNKIRESENINKD